MAYQLIKVTLLSSLDGSAHRPVRKGGVELSRLRWNLTDQALRAENVDYIVAPYEADAQLCMLEREGIVDGIITEDSDLLVFGCKQVSVSPIASRIVARVASQGNLACLEWQYPRC